MMILTTRINNIDHFLLNLEFETGMLLLPQFEDFDL